MAEIESAITVVIVDDHPIVRAGMKTVLDRAADIHVVAEGANGQEALDLVATHKPTVLVLDVNLPGTNGLEVIRNLRQRETSTLVLILTAYDDSQTVMGLLGAGASGYVIKDEALESLERAVRCVAEGKSWLSPTVAQQVVRRATGQIPVSEHLSSCQLTPREEQVLGLLAQGLDNATIANRLVVTKRTVQNHVSSIYAKLEVSSRTEAALYAIRHGLATVSPADEFPDVP